MYSCKLKLYLIGCPSVFAEIIENMPPMENFTHEFIKTQSEDLYQLSKADIIFLQYEDNNRLQYVFDNKKQTAEVILIAQKEQLNKLLELPHLFYDIWFTPLSENEIRFRFLKFQRHKKLEKDNWQTENYFETLINSVPNLIWFKNKNGIHEKVNDSFCKTVHKTKKQVEGRDHFFIWDVAPDDPDNNAEDCAQSDKMVMDSGITCTSEETVQSGDDLMLLNTYKSPLYDLDGSVMGTVGVAMDITKERKYECEIIEKNNTLETLFSTIDCGMIIHKVSDSEIISINPAALQILGYDSQEELEKNGFNVIAPSVLDEDKPKLKETIQSLKNVGDSVNTEYRVRHKNGDIVYVMGEIKLSEENGEPVYQRFLVDCTTQRVREYNERETIKRHNSDLIQALTSDYNLVVCIDLGSGLGYSIRVEECPCNILKTYFNENIIFGESMEQYINHCVYEEDRELLAKASSIQEILNSLSEKNVFSVNYRVICNGKMSYYQMKCVKTGYWSMAEIVVIGFRSIDSEMREEIKKKQMLEEALMQANRANKAKSIFLSNMSHDIRTPMNAILGFTALALSHTDRKEQVEDYLKKIMSSSNHLLGLINDVLDMSRIESGKMKLEEKPCSLSDLLHGIVNIVQTEARSKQLDLSMDASEIKDEDIYCDKLRLNQVLLNLLSNSIKYTEAGGAVSLTVREAPHTEGDSAAYTFIVKDNGMGMSPEFLRHIFEPFERERNSTISKIQGTGLGMTITKNIVEMMKGTIAVESEPNKGTTVTVTVNFRINKDVQKPCAIPQLKGKRALVVDDDYSVCDSVSDMLQQLGMRVEWTLSGKEAVMRTLQAVSRNDCFSVYIVDWLLPDISGIEVIRKIRKEINSDAPIVIITAYDWTDIEEEAREAGVTAFCRKPLFFSELHSTLLSIISPDDNEKEEKQPLYKCRAGRILLAEDVELNQEIAVAILSDAGFTVDVADNGQIAVDMLQNSQPGYYQAVLMDIQMPVLNGYGAAKAIRALENKELANIPILAMSANAFEEDKQEALKSGMNGHIPKPVDIEALFKALDSVL